MEEINEKTGNNNRMCREIFIMNYLLFREEKITQFSI